MIPKDILFPDTNCKWAWIQDIRILMKLFSVYKHMNINDSTFGDNCTILYISITT